jgi:hypothetical protein
VPFRLVDLPNGPLSSGIRRCDARSGLEDMVSTKCCQKMFCVDLNLTKVGNGENGGILSAKFSGTFSKQDGRSWETMGANILGILIRPRKTLTVGVDGSFCFWNRMDLHTSSPSRGKAGIHRVHRCKIKRTRFGVVLADAILDSPKLKSQKGRRP